MLIKLKSILFVAVYLLIVCLLVCCIVTSLSASSPRTFHVPSNIRNLAARPLHPKYLCIVIYRHQQQHSGSSSYYFPLHHTGSRCAASFLFKFAIILNQPHHPTRRFFCITNGHSSAAIPPILLCCTANLSSLVPILVVCPGQKSSVLVIPRAGSPRYFDTLPYRLARIATTNWSSSVGPRIPIEGRSSSSSNISGACNRLPNLSLCTQLIYTRSRSWPYHYCHRRGSRCYQNRVSR